MPGLERIASYRLFQRQRQLEPKLDMAVRSLSETPTSQHNVENLEGPSENWQVASTEDKENGGKEGQGSGTRVFPLINLA